MDLEELDATLHRLGLPNHRSQMGGGWEQVGRDRASLIVQNDRSAADVVDFGSEDALCRWLLVRSLLAQPPAARRVPAAPRLLPPIVEPDPADPGADGDPSWRRPLAPMSRVAARGGGTVIVEDTASLLAHGGEGALVQQAIDVANGRARWTRPVWPPAARPTVGIADDCLLSWADGRLSAHELSSGQERWTVRCAERPRLLAHAPGRGVLTAGPAVDAPLPARGIDLMDGRTLWKASISDPVYALDGPEARAALHHVEHHRGELVLSEISVADGTRRTLTRVPCPPGYAQAHLLLIFHSRDERGELALVRGRSQRRRGEVGTRLGDLVLLVDRGELVTIDPEPRIGHAHLLVGVDGEHLLRRPVRPHEGHLTLWRPADGGERWSREGGGTLVRRSRGLTILRESPFNVKGLRASRTVAVEDDGRVRWSAPGSAVVSLGDELWLADEHELRGVALQDGVERWRRPLPAPTPRPWYSPNGLLGHRADDGHAIWVADEHLLAFGPSGM